MQNKFVTMHELAKVTLGNEMDLVLAHKRSMKLGEIAGLSLSAQTTFATAVSEVSRTVINSGTGSCLVLCVQTEGPEKYIVASIRHDVVMAGKVEEGLEYARRLVDKYNVARKGQETFINLFFLIPVYVKIDTIVLDIWKGIFRNEPP